jgi:methylenetetrahydrofolate dehydrogenase (NADP+)/methenyltetrahydrofolate cyclohydrolase
MAAQILDGKATSKIILEELRQRIGGKFPPCLAVILCSTDPASQLYVRRKQNACHEVGIKSYLLQPSENVATAQQLETYLLRTIRELNQNPGVNGILVQLPLPYGADAMKVFDVIDPIKDVDVFSPTNVGLLSQGRARYIPCTPHGISELLKRNGLSTEGKKVVVISRSNIVGKPLGSLLIQDTHNATVTICHDRTPPELLRNVCHSADIVVVGVGKPGFLTEDMVAPGQIIIDVGTTRVNGKLMGDAAAGVADVVDWITPVPGGVGPMTVAMLLQNTVEAYEQADLY